jgi:hypothetical protein
VNRKGGLQSPVICLAGWRQQKAGIMPALLLLSRLHNSSQMMPREQHRNTAARMSLPNTHSLGVLSLTEKKSRQRTTPPLPSQTIYLLLWLPMKKLLLFKNHTYKN